MFCVINSKIIEIKISFCKDQIVFCIDLPNYCSFLNAEVSENYVIKISKILAILCKNGFFKNR